MEVWSSFSNLFVTSPTSQLILQLFRRFTYVTDHSPTLLLLHRRHSSFPKPSFASPTSQALHLIHLASRPWLAECHSNRQRQYKQRTDTQSQERNKNYRPSQNMYNTVGHDFDIMLDTFIVILLLY